MEFIEEETPVSGRALYLFVFRLVLLCRARESGRVGRRLHCPIGVGGGMRGEAQLE